MFDDVYRAASRAYRPDRYQGRAVLIHTESQHAIDPEVWRDLILTGLKKSPCLGNHAEILHEPQVGVLADHLRNCLDEAREARLMNQ
jgi:hypothetical protein